MDEYTSSNNERLWLLVEESYSGRTNYSIVDLEEVIGAPTKDNMIRGKTVKIRKGKLTLPVTVVIISDDREFLENEMLKLRNASSMVIKEEPTTSVIQTPLPKRRRTQNEITILNEQNFPPQNPFVTIQNNTATAMTGERLYLSCSSPGPASAIPLPHRIISAPPMTFDQQTQTDVVGPAFDESPHFMKDEILSSLRMFVAAQETVLQQQKCYVSESAETNKLVHTLVEQMDILKAMVVDANMKIGQLEHKNFVPQNSPILLNSSQLMNNSSISGTQLSSTTDQSEYIITLHTGTSNNNSRSSFDEANCSTSSDYGSAVRTPLGVQKKYNSHASLNESNSLASGIITDWVKDEINEITVGTESDFVVIGSNKTEVAGHIIRQIDWKSHTGATRKLLMALFDRDILATHSLTGKPSPAFIGRQKEIKNELDAKKVADIIQIVTKRCGVPVSAVRNAITTKCADENKMNRQRQFKVKSNSAALRDVDDNKENSRK